MVYGMVIYVSCYGNLTVKQKNKLSHVISQTNKITEHKQHTLQGLFSHFMKKKKAIAILKDHTHPLHSIFEILASGHRLKIKKEKEKIVKNRLLKKSFVLMA